MVIFHRFLSTGCVLSLLLAVSYVNALSKEPRLSVDCKINIKDFPSIKDYSIEKNDVLIEGSQYSKTGHMLVSSIENFEFRVTVAESLSIGEESEITGFFTEIKDTKSGLTSRSRSGVNYINDKSRASQINLLYYENSSAEVKGYMRFECSSRIEGPNIVQRLNKNP